MTIQAGFDPSDTITSANRVVSGKGFSIGTTLRDHKGQEWVYVQAGSAIPQYNVVRILASGTAAPFTSAGLGGTAGGIRTHGISASASIAADSYGWIMTKGQAAIKVSASSTGTIVPTALLYAALSAQPGLCQTTASSGFALVGVNVVATATTSTTASTVAVAFWSGIEMTSAAE